MTAPALVEVAMRAMNRMRVAGFALELDGPALVVSPADRLSGQALLASGHVRCADDIYWLADPGQQSAAALLNTQKRKTRETEE